MIIDSHAHYSHNSFAAEFPYLTHSKTGFALDRGDLPQLLQQMQHGARRQHRLTTMTRPITGDRWVGILVCRIMRIQALP